MLVQSLIERKNGTHVNMGNNKYHFKPDESGRHVCEVTVKKHQERFLSIKEGYQEIKNEPTPA